MPILQDSYDPGLKFSDVVEELVQLPDHHHPDTNLRVMQFSFRWLKEYLQIHDGTKTQVFDWVTKAVERNREFTPSAASIMRGKSNPDTDAFAVHCLSDVHGTAALVREIIFQRVTNPRSGADHTSVDLGSGSGVLLAASMIRGLRQGATNVMGYGFDSQTRSIELSRNVLRRIPGTTFETIQADITKSNTYDRFRDIEGKVGMLGIKMSDQVGIPVDAWVSETITYGTPAMVVQNGKVRTLGRPTLFDLVGGQIDPFEAVIGNIVSLPGIENAIRENRIALFPNVINEDYVPDAVNGWLLLHTSPHTEHRQLKDVGADLREQYFGSFGNRRWW